MLLKGAEGNTGLKVGKELGKRKNIAPKWKKLYIIKMQNYMKRNNK